MIDEKIFRLDGKVAVVTGGSSGIGLGCARFLSEMGSSVVLADIDEAGGRSAEAAIGRGSLFVRCDVSSDEDCRNMASAVIARFGQVDILVNCAGMIRRKDVVQLTEKEWDLSIDVTLKGIYLVSRHLIPFMARGGRREHSQHSLRMGDQGGAEGRLLLRCQGRCGKYDKGHGHRSRPPEYSCQFRLSR